MKGTFFKITPAVCPEVYALLSQNSLVDNIDNTLDRLRELGYKIQKCYTGRRLYELPLYHCRIVKNNIQLRIHERVIVERDWCLLLPLEYIHSRLMAEPSLYYKLPAPLQAYFHSEFPPTGTDFGFLE